VSKAASHKCAFSNKTLTHSQRIFCSPVRITFHHDILYLTHLLGRRPEIPLRRRSLLHPIPHRPLRQLPHHFRDSRTSHRASIYLLYNLFKDQDGKLDSHATGVCIAILLVCTLLFSGVLSLFTRAKRHEILGAAAAYVNTQISGYPCGCADWSRYCAVLVVFLGNVPGSPS
jgi:hypothetical protein